ncbi:hypothetical protein [Chryseobacterium sp. CCH4-E10]|uniref:hypothetical protein n=1 Tax=Chryseobacterium sp. CCH4-E10 TaxID=1768758 RepID=UPI000833319A|nr:hypothetical protein [Chryseobacterium sp. CCH4-E10]
MKEIDIKKAAISILLKEGNFDCSVLDIAQKGNVSHSIIHYYYYYYYYYYYRTKEKLMLTVYEEILENFVSKRYDCLISQKNMKFEERIKKYLECTIDILQQYPYLDIYLRNPDYKRIFKKNSLFL